MSAEDVLTTIDASLSIEVGDVVWVFDHSRQSVMQANVLTVTETHCALLYPDGASPTIAKEDIRRTMKDALLRGTSVAMSSMRGNLEHLDKQLKAAFATIDMLTGVLTAVSLGEPLPDPDTYTHIFSDQGAGMMCGLPYSMWSQGTYTYDDEAMRMAEEVHRPWCPACVRVRAMRP